VARSPSQSYIFDLGKRLRRRTPQLDQSGMHNHHCIPCLSWFVYEHRTSDSPEQSHFAAVAVDPWTPNPPNLVFRLPEIDRIMHCHLVSIVPRLPVFLGRLIYVEVNLWVCSIDVTHQTGVPVRSFVICLIEKPIFFQRNDLRS
jgi:hypothetical protein